MAQTLPQLVVARVVQGIGGGGLIAMAQAMIADAVPMRERGRFQVYVSSVWAGASVAGPVVGGMLTQYLSWPWIFWINIPVCILAIVMVRRTPVAIVKITHKVRVDWLGILLLVVGLTAFLIPVTRIGQGVALHESRNLVGLAIAAVGLTWFWLHELRTPEPIIPITMLREPVVVMCCTILFVCFSLFVAMSVLVPLRLQLVAGAQPGEAALAMLPYTLANPISGFVAGRWIYRTGRVVPAQRFGAILAAFSMFALALLSPSHTILTAIALGLLGTGLGSQMPTTLMVLQNSVHQSLLGTATSLSAFFRLLGGAIGIAVLSAVVLALLRDKLPAGLGSHGLEGLGTLLGQAGNISAAAAKASDMAFRYTLLAGGVFALINVFCVSRMPDVRLHSSGPKPVMEID
jgi:MFS family permease